MSLNLPPIRPINTLGGGLGGGLRPTGGSFNGIRPLNNLGPAPSPGVAHPGVTRPVSNTTRSAFDNIDVEEIGKGRLLVEGAYHKELGTKRYSGLKGQLMKFKIAGKHTVTKNLSMGNVKQIHGLIADRLKNKLVGSQTSISRQDRLAILKESRKLVKTAGSKFTWEDRKDLEKVVNNMRQQYKDRLFHRGEDSDK